MHTLCYIWYTSNSSCFMVRFSNRVITKRDNRRSRLTPEWRNAKGNPSALAKKLRLCCIQPMQKRSRSSMLAMALHLLCITSIRNKRNSGSLEMEFPLSCIKANCYQSTVVDVWCSMIYVKLMRVTSRIDISRIKMIVSADITYRRFPLLLFTVR